MHIVTENTAQFPNNTALDVPTILWRIFAQITLLGHRAARSGDESPVSHRRDPTCGRQSGIGTVLPLPTLVYPCY